MNAKLIDLCIIICAVFNLCLNISSSVSAPGGKLTATANEEMIWSVVRLITWCVRFGSFLLSCLCKRRRCRSPPKPPLCQMYSLMAVTPFSRIMFSVTRWKWFRSSKRNMAKMSRCWLGNRIPLISFWSSMCRMCLEVKSDHVSL